VDGRLKLGGDMALKTTTGAPLQPWDNIHLWGYVDPRMVLTLIVKNG